MTDTASHRLGDPLANDGADLAVARIQALANARQRIQHKIVDTATRAGFGALLAVGSAGRGGADAFSDLDLIAVPEPASAPLTSDPAIARRLLAVLDDTSQAPAGGQYVGWCLAAADTVLWAEIFVWPAATAAVPADATVIFDHLGLPASPLRFIPLINTHLSPPPHPTRDPDVAELADVATAAKHLSRNQFDRIREIVGDDTFADRPTVTSALLQRLDRITAPRLAAAVERTRRLISLASHAAATHTNPVPDQPVQGRKAGPPADSPRIV